MPLEKSGNLFLENDWKTGNFLFQAFTHCFNFPFETYSQFIIACVKDDPGTTLPAEQNHQYLEMQLLSCAARL